eukprot:775294-Pyramimonas_sp.AAC.1
MGLPRGRRKRRPCIGVHKTPAACIIGKPMVRSVCLSAGVRAGRGAELWATSTPTPAITPLTFVTSSIASI